MVYVYLVRLAFLVVIPSVIPNYFPNFAVENIAEELGVTRKTVGTWDAKLVELGVLDEDDRIYLYVQSVPEQKIFKTSIPAEQPKGLPA